MPCAHGVKKAIMHRIPIIPFQLSFLYDSSKNMCIKYRLAEDRISELEDRMVEINESERIKEKQIKRNEDNLRDLQDKAYGFEST